MVVRDLPPGAQFFSEAPFAYPPISCHLFHCDSCDHSFLSTEPVSYYKNVIRSTSVSSEMTTFRRKQFSEIRTSLFPVSRHLKCLEIGAGSGSYSSLLCESFDICLATEHEFSEPQTSNHNIRFIGTHPDDPDFVELLSKESPFDMICCFSYVEHLQNPSIIFSKCRELLCADGYLLIEVPNSSFILRENLINEIIPDHLHYFTTYSLQRLALRENYSIVRSQPIWYNYIISGIFKKRELLSIDGLNSAQDIFCKEVESLLDKYPISAQIAVWGAGHQSLFALSYTSLSDRVSFIVDSSKDKQGLFTPSSNLSIFPPSHLLSIDLDLLIISCAGYNDEVYKLAKDMSLSCDIVILDLNTFKTH